MGKYLSEVRLLVQVI